MKKTTVSTTSLSTNILGTPNTCTTSGQHHKMQADQRIRLACAGKSAQELRYYNGITH